ncbi:heavy-metal-associated domain-containing protein [candidate division KSB1 bacterium]|nr:heavy-metal-associated domain-containing protein [candidate division KSB1 bacterium]
MKNIVSFLLLFTIAAFAGDKKEHNHSDHNPEMKMLQHEQDSSKQTISHVMISLPTIQCDNCVNTIENAVNNVQGVESVKVDLEKKKAHINYDADKVKTEDIENAITASGYDANDRKRDEQAHDALLACCQSKR